jgi:outer membrane protein OmpA-like peptidoglycan-associated protein
LRHSNQISIYMQVPRFAFNIGKSFAYQQGTNPDFPDQVQGPEVKGDMSDVKKTQISMQIGAGYDIHVSSPENKTQFVISPFVAYQPYFGQTPRSIETWNISTIRAGASFKFGVGKRSKSADREVAEPVKNTPVVVAPAFSFTVNAPANIASERTVRETFPLRNYVFFNLGSTAIPNRYVLLKKEQVNQFKEEQVELFTPNNLSGRSDRQMIVYYNILNILGDRMVKNPSSTIKLVGSSEQGTADGLLMAGSVKDYLVTIFSINASRIITEGSNSPKIPSKQPGGTEELVLLSEGDRRVSIESTSPALLMEFQSGPNASLKPVQIIGTQEAPLESYVTFNNNGSNKVFKSWSMEIRDDKGVVQQHGPYTVETVTIPGKTIMGIRPEGRYNVKMTGITPAGSTISKDTTVRMVLWTPSKEEVAMRFSVIYEFNESKAITIYEKYLTEVVTPQIPVGSTVIIHGYTDIIGDAAHNLKLSQQRAEDVSKIIKAALAKAGRTDVKFDVHGSGEDTKLSPFNNKYPEERFYNRSVIIDIIPKK